MSRRLGRIFFGHVLREIVVAVVSVSVVLLLLLVTNQVASVLRRAADGEIPASVVFELARLSVGENSVVILPIALLIGILLALGRLYHDSEMAAAQACGLGRKQLYGPAFLVALGAALLCGWIAFSAGPAAAKRIYDIRADALRTALTRGLAPGQFRSLGGGAVLYFRERDGEGLLREVFFQRPVPDAKAEGTVEVMLADSASYALSADSTLYTVILHDGKRHEGIPGKGAWRTLSFSQLTVPIPVPTATNYRGRADMLTTRQLIDDPTPKNLGELHWRIATVCITLLLGVLAVPLSKLRPRQGRYARVGWGVLLYALYANLLIAGRTMLEQGRLPGWLGLWWVHVLVAGLALLALTVPKVLHRMRVARLAAAA
ncbi:MAG: LPS export ABC transporter permease LptF [Steroidobacteraceae bacterium]